MAILYLALSAPEDAPGARRRHQSGKPESRPQRRTRSSPVTDGLASSERSPGRIRRTKSGARPHPVRGDSGSLCSRRLEPIEPLETLEPLFVQRTEAAGAVFSSPLPFPPFFPSPSHFTRPFPGWGGRAEKREKEGDWRLNGGERWRKKKIGVERKSGSREPIKGSGRALMEIP